VLSGFLIGRILLKIVSSTDFTKKDLLNFWIRRWFRTIPNYLFVLMLVLVFNGGFHGFSLKYLIFSQNFLSIHPLFFPESWSLSVEEWFYFLFPISCLIAYRFSKSKIRSILIPMMLFIIIPLVFRLLKFSLGFEDIDESFREATLLRIDSIIYGVIGAYVFVKYPKFWNDYRFVLLTFGLLIMSLFCLNIINWKSFYGPLVFNIESLIILLFLPFLSSLKSTKSKSIDIIFIFISIISYSMYLLNMSLILGDLIPISHKVLNTFSIENSIPLDFLLYWFYTIFLSYILYVFYENPMTKIRDKVKIK